ncbi:MAG: ThuA domain-containing protein [Verrucomicrobiales bacterium]
MHHRYRRRPDDPADPGEGEPWTWTREPGKGKVFYTAYGHDQRTFSNPGFHELMYRGLMWAVGEEKRKQLYALKLPELKRMDGYQVPNYENRPEPIKVQEPLKPAESVKHTQVLNGMAIVSLARKKMGSST